MHCICTAYGSASDYVFTGWEGSAMTISPRQQIKLAQSRKGRCLLHIAAAIWGHRNIRWALAGVRREVREAVAANPNLWN